VQSLHSVLQFVLNLHTLSPDNIFARRLLNWIVGFMRSLCPIAYNHDSPLDIFGETCCNTLLLFCMVEDSVFCMFLKLKTFFTLIISSLSYLGIAISMISKEIFDTCPEIKIVTEYDDSNFYNFSLTIRDFQDEHPNEAFNIKDFMDYMKNRFENSSWGSRSKFLMNYEVLSVYLDKLVSLRNAIRKEYQSQFYYKIISSSST
jgi:hypothetical protein